MVVSADHIRVPMMVSFRLAQTSLRMLPRRHVALNDGIVARVLRPLEQNGLLIRDPK